MDEKYSYSNIDDVKGKVSFNLYYPNYLPKGFRSKEATINRQEDLDKIISIDFKFIAGKNFITINQQPVLLEEDKILIDKMKLKGRNDLESRYYSSKFIKKGIGISVSFSEGFTDGKEMMKIIDSLKLIE